MVQVSIIRLVSSLRKSNDLSQFLLPPALIPTLLVPVLLAFASLATASHTSQYNPYPHHSGYCQISIGVVEERCQSSWKLRKAGAATMILLTWRQNQENLEYLKLSAI